MRNTAVYAPRAKKAGVAPEDVPGGGDDDVLEDDVAGEVEIGIHPQRRDEDSGRHHGQPHGERAGRLRHLASEQAGRSHGEGDEQDAEGHGERPRGAVEGGHEALDHAEDDRGHQSAPDAAHAAEHGNGEHPADVIAVAGRDDRRDGDEERARETGGRDADAEGDRLDLDGVGPHEPEGQTVLRDGHDGSAVEGTAEEETESQRHGKAYEARHEQAIGDPHARELDRLADVPRLHEPIVDAELQAETDLDDEEEAEEEDEPAQRLLAAPLEAPVVDAVDGGSEQVEEGGEEEAGEDGEL